MQQLAKATDDLTRSIARKSLKADIEELAVLQRCVEMLNNKQAVRDGAWNYKEVEVLNKYLFMSSKPIVYLVNIGRDEYIRKQNKWLPRIMEWIKANGGGPCLPFSAEYEKEVLATAGTPEKFFRDAAAEEIGAPTMIHKIVNCGYRTLQLWHYFTAGEDEVKCWTIRKGTKAPGAAGVIHTDFERGFICAEVMKYEDLARCGTELEVKAEGLYH